MKNSDKSKTVLLAENKELRRKLREREKDGEKGPASREWKIDYHSLFHEFPEGLVLAKPESGEIEYCNPAFEEITGRTFSELQGKKIWDFISPGEVPEFQDIFLTGKIAKKEISIEVNLIQPNRKSLPAIFLCKMITCDNRDFVLVKAVELSGQQEVTQNLKKMNRALRVLSEFNQQLVRIDSESQLLEAICRILVEIGGYKLAWVGYAGKGPDRNVVPMAQYGYEKGYIESIQVTWKDDAYGQGPTGTAIRTGQVSICRNILTDPRFSPWREQAKQHGYSASIALPLITNHTPMGALNIYAVEANAFNPDEVNLLQEVANDLAFGLSAIQVREEARKAKQQLQQSEEKYRSLVENAPDFILIVNREGQIQFINHTIPSYSMEDALRATTFDFTPPEFHDLIRKNLNIVFNEGRPVSYETQGKGAGGENRWYSTRVAPIKLKDRVISATMISSDITELKHTEIALREQSRRNEQILRSTLDGYILADTHGQIIDVNPSYCQMVQYSKEELQKMNIREMERKIPTSEMDRRIKQMVAKGWDRFETCHKRKDGEVLDLEVSIVIMQPEKEPLVAAFVRDISERKRSETLLKESEANLRSLINARDESIWSIDKNYNYLIFNEFFRKAYFGAYQIELEKGMNALKLLSPDLKKFWKPKYERALSGKRTVFEFSAEIRKEVHYYQVTMNPILVANEVVGVSAISSDITAKKTAEQALKESEERFRLAFQTSPDSININRLHDGLYVDINSGFTEITGYTRQETIGKTSLDINIWADPGDRQKLVAGLKKQGQVKNLEARFRMKGGTLVHGLMSAAVITLNGIPHILSVTRNIEKMKKAENALRESEIRYRNLFEHSPVSLWEEDFSELYQYLDQLKSQGVSDLKGYFNEHPVEVQKCSLMVKVTDVNQATLRLHQAKSKKDLLGNLEKIFTKESLETFQDEVIALSEGKSYFEAEGVVSTLLGNPRHILLNLYIENPGEKGSRHALVATRDISQRVQFETALQESEAKFRSLTEEALVGVYIIQDTVFKYVNPKFAEIFGYRAEKIIGRLSPEKLTNPADWPLVKKNLRERISGKVQALHYEFRGRTREGNTIWVEVHGSRSVYRGAPAVLGTLLDITERKKAEEQLRQTTNQLRALSAHLQSIREEERTAIAHEIHDEIGQVLTVLKMNLSFLGRDMREQKGGVDLESFNLEIQKMNELIDNTIRKLREIITRLRPEVLEQLGLLSALEWQVDEFRKHSGIECVFDYQGEEEIELDGDRSTAIYRIFQEALTNISRHARASRVNIQLSAGKEVLSLTIEDNGIGFSSTDLSKVETFGMLGMRERAASFGGELLVESAPDQGSILTLKMPCK